MKFIKKDNRGERTEMSILSGRGVCVCVRKFGSNFASGFVKIASRTSERNTENSVRIYAKHYHAKCSVVTTSAGFLINLLLCQFKVTSLYDVNSIINSVW